MSYKNYKKRLKINILQIVVGIVLLFVVFLWTNKYPSEWNAFRVQFGVLESQIKIWFYSIFTNVGDKVKEKQQIERSFDSIIGIVKESGCITGEKLFNLEKSYKKIKNMSVRNYLNNRNVIRYNLGLIYENIKKDCPNIKFPKY